MNKVPVIRKNSYKDYLNTSILGGFFIGLIFGFIALMNTGSFMYFLGVGGALWILIIFIYMLIGFPREEYFKRKKRIEKLESGKYIYLYENNFKLHEDLFFEGIYNEYYIRIYPIIKWAEKGDDIEYEIIEAYYDFDENKLSCERETDLSGEYFLGKLNFENQVVTYVPRDGGFVNFKENLEGLMNILKREALYPIDISVWKKKIGEFIKKEKEDELESRTVHLLKIGKILDVKYIKAEK